MSPSSGSVSRERKRVCSVWPRPIPERLGEPFPEVVHAALARRAVQRLAAGPGLDIVHDHTLAGPLNAPIYANLGLPTVVTAHGPVDGDLHQLYSALGRDVHLVAISDRQRELAPDLPWAGRVHNAIRVDTFPFRREKGDYALFLGRFHPRRRRTSRWRPRTPPGCRWCSPASAPSRSRRSTSSARFGLA